MNAAPSLSLCGLITCCVLSVLVGWLGCRGSDDDAARRLSATVYQAQTLAAGGRDREARNLLQDAIESHTMHGSGVGDALLTLGDLYTDAARFDSARMMYERSMEEFRAGADRPSTYLAVERTIALLRLMAQEREALDLCTETLRLARVFGNRRQALDIRKAMIPIARALDRTDEEHKLITELLQAARDSGDASVEAAVMLESGNGKLFRGEYDAATQDFLQAITIADNGRDSVTSVKSLLSLARSLSAAGRTREALDTYTTAVQRLNQMSGAHELRLETLLRIGNLYLRIGRPDQATRFYQSAHALAADLGNRLAEGFALIQVVHSARESDETARAGYQDALQIFQRTGVVRGSAYALRCLGRLAERRRQLTDALQFYKSSVQDLDQITVPREYRDVYDECQEAFVGADGGSSYDDIIELLVQIGKPEEAFWYLERRNAREVYRCLNPLELATSQPQVDGAIDTLRRVRAHAIAAERQLEHLLAVKPHHGELIDSVVHTLDASRKLLRAKSEQLARMYPFLEPTARFDGMRAADVQNRVPEDGVVLVYAITPRSVYTFAVTRERTAVFVSAGGRSRVTFLADEYLQLLRVRSVRIDSVLADPPASRRRLEDLARSLYEVFLLPVESSLRTTNRVFVVYPAGEPTVPIHALRRRASLSTPYLAERCLVSYLPTCRSLPLKGVGSAQAKHVLGLGHPGSTSWDVEYELRDIRAFYREARLFFGREASLDTLQTLRGDVLHLALVLRFPDQLPGTACVLMSDGQSASTYRRVSLGQLLSVPSSETVLFSNIQDRFVSVHAAVPQLFLATGTRTMIINCVPASRRAKKIFGEMYYTALMTGSSSPAAFRKAQQELIRSREYGSPEVWAPFMMWGN